MEAIKKTANAKKACIKRGCGVTFNSSNNEAREHSTLRAFWQKYCPEHRALPSGEKTIIFENTPTLVESGETE